MSSGSLRMHRRKSKHDQWGDAEHDHWSNAEDDFYRNQYVDPQPAQEVKGRTPYAEDMAEKTTPATTTTTPKPWTSVFQNKRRNIWIGSIVGVIVLIVIIVVASTGCQSTENQPANP